MTTIHYELSHPDLAINPNTDRGRSECARLARRAINIAKRICSEIDEGAFDDPIITADRFIIDLHFEGHCRGSEPISYGWTMDFEPPQHWDLRGFCKTVLADDPIRAHLLVSHILHAWQIAGLIDTIHDERGYMPERNLRSFLGATTEAEIPGDVNALVSRLQAAVANVVG